MWKKNGFARVLKNKKWGFIDNQCNILVNPKYDYANDFSKDIAKVQLNGKTGYINTKGEQITNVLFDSGYNFN